MAEIAPLITVNVLQARDLASADSNGFSDPYVLLTLGGQKKKTKVVKKNLNPQWQESFTFDVSRDDRFLFVQVFDWDLASADDFLGHITIDLTAVDYNGGEMWYRLGQRPDRSDENVVGEILLSFKRGAAPSETRRSASSVVEEIKQKITEGQQTGGVELDLSGCDLAKVPKVVIDTFLNLVNFNLGFNKLTAFPEVAPFQKLQVLDLTGNQIASIPPTVTTLINLKELYMNGNQLTAIPDALCNLTSLEKLHFGNNRISSLSSQIGKLRKLEELILMGNPLPQVPPSIGCCNGMEVLDLSCCNLTTLPGEFTYMTRLMELNLATNGLKELPQSMGRMTRLVVLNLSDNDLTDLPLSMGKCIGLSKFGAGANIERNPIKDEAMIKKYRIGPDHLVDYLEKRMITEGEPVLEEFQLPNFGTTPTPTAATTTSALSSSSGAPKNQSPQPQWGLKRAESLGVQIPGKQSTAPVATTTTSPAQQQPTATLDDKIVALKKWAHTTIQQELRFKLNTIQTKSDTTTDPQQAIQLAQVIKSLKPEVEKAKQQIPPFEIPKANLNPEASRLDQVKAVISAALGELALTLRGIQKILEMSTDSKEIIAMVQLVKNLKAILETAQM